RSKHGAIHEMAKPVRYRGRAGCVCIENLRLKCGQRLAMTMSPLNVRIESVALPSPKVARIEWLSGRRGARSSRPRRAESLSTVIGRSDRIVPLKLVAFSSNPVGFASVMRTEPECVLI